MPSAPLLSPSLSALARPDAGWSFILYPDAAEGSGRFRSSDQPKRVRVPKGSAADPARAAAEGGRRAKSKLRRYCAANRLNRLGTLTYAGDGCRDPKALRGHLGEFFRTLRGHLGGDPFPYAWVPEWHKSHGLHAHFAIGRYVKKSAIEKAWGRGFVHIKLLGDLPVGSGKLSEARRAAGYLSKYVAKTFTDPQFRDLGRHRYDVAQGFQPASLHLSGTSAAEVLGQASQFLGSRPERRWSSSDAQDWAGAPTIWAQWGA
ncbi:rolling circle replication-associated protein [Sinomonas humi]|uniref:Replication-associated protein ORF2/G2P domain-containing protein n=1 Tax=Sinomonas humi TaxID=1338436 RepID=A0A0B2ACJ7_9MICC|nr:hypothetical protein [Sinomonas humi]KHL00946.1 hypothetical protein LK10_18255 [Sinomonas humi]